MGAGRRTRRPKGAHSHRNSGRQTRQFIFRAAIVDRRGWNGPERPVTAAASSAVNLFENSAFRLFEPATIVVG